MNLDELLSPIEDADPRGIDLRSEATDHQSEKASFHLACSEFSSLKKEESYIDPLSDQDPRVAGSPRGRAERRRTLDWDGLRDRLVALATNSRDVEVASMLAVVSLRTGGMTGLRDGLALIRRLLETYGSNLYPEPEIGGTVEDTLFAVSHLDNTLEEPLRWSNLAAHDELPYIAYKQRHANDASSERSALIEAGWPSLEQVNEAIVDSGSEHFQALLASLAAAESELDGLNAMLAEHGVDDQGNEVVPPLRALRSQLKEYRQDVEDLCAEHFAAALALGDDDASPVDSAPRTVGQSKALQTREQAFAEIERIAAFFQDAEPHSPVSYTLRQVVRWGRLSLPELLVEVLSDENERGNMFRLLGIPTPSSPEG